MPTPTPRDKFWFILGREPLIAAAEIGAVLGFGKNYEYAPPILKVDGLSLREKRSNPKDNEITTVAQGDLAMTEPAILIKRLGGTIKIAKEMADSVTEEKLKNIIIEELKTVEGKINFGLSIYSQTNINLKEVKNLGLQIKKALKEEGLSVRYVENRETILSSVTVEKNGLTGRGREFLIEKSGDAFSLAKTEAVQPFEEFSARDFGRPGRDSASGMLPPKLAMMMINLAQAPKNGVLLDPFCGSGTIISEAALLGYKILIGSDNSEKAIADSKKNIEWIKQKFPISNFQFPINFQVSNVQNLSRILKHESIDAVVTEPYLGKPLRGQETREELLKQTNELKTLYIEAFRQFSSILKPNGVVVFIIPRFSAKGGSASGGKFSNEWITIDCKNNIETLGFKSVPFLEQHPYLLYARPDQRVGREIWKFEKI